MASVGQKNTTHNEEESIDFLENDIPIPGQNYVCLSFVSPESCIKDKHTFMMYNFMKNNHDFSGTFDEFKKSYDDYVANDEDKLQTAYNNSTDFTTSVRGLKVRGVYESMVEAKYRAKQLQRKDPHFNVFVGQVGFWLPWDPAPGEIKEQEYLNDQLNTLMKSYRENQSKKDMLWEQNKEKVLAKAHADTSVATSSNDGETKENVETVENVEMKMAEPDPWLKRRVDEASGASEK